MQKTTPLAHLHALLVSQYLSAETTWRPVTPGSLISREYNELPQQIYKGGGRGV
jgi:hypothetical protein